MTKQHQNPGAPRRGLVAVRADAGDPRALVASIKSAFEQFKEANDQRLAAIEAGKADDAVLAEKVEKINAHISELQGQLADIATRSASLGLNAGQEDSIAKAAAKFAAERGQEISLDDFKAYQNGLNVYMRRGKSAPQAVMAAMSVGSDPDGGYTVTPDMSGRIAMRIYESSPMRQLASVDTIGTDRMEGFNDLDEGSAGWVGETQPRTATSTPGLGRWEIPVHEMYAYPEVTQKLLEDSGFDIESWLERKTGDKFARTEAAAFLNGDGVLKPKGLLTYPTLVTTDATRAWGKFQHVLTGSDGSFGTTPNGSDKLISVVFSLKAAYRANANWMMSRATLGAVRTLKDGDGNYLWQPNFEQRQGGTLLGYAIAEGEDMPTMAADSLSIAFGDFRETYQILDRLGTTILRDELTNKGFVGFYTRKRVGGAAINFESMKFLKFGD